MSRAAIHAILLFAAVIVSQLANIIYEGLRNGQDVSLVILPSMVFLATLTIPSLFIGFRLGRQVGLSLDKPHQSYARTEGLSPVVFVVASSILLGLFLLGVRQFSLPYLPEEIPQYGFRRVIGGFLVSVGAAIGEEVWFRFGLMTLLLWFIRNVFRPKSISLLHVWIVMFIVAIGFGAAHLPQLVAYGAGSQFAIWGTMIGNLLVSFLYGWCYWRCGLVSAIGAHFTLDLVLHVLPALF